MKSPTPKKNIETLLSIAAFALLLGLMAARMIYPELLWLTIGISGALVATLAGLLRENQKALRSRAAAFGLNSAVTIILTLTLLGVVNFVAYRYPFKFDLTRNKVNTLSEQTVKLVKGLQKPVKAVFFGNLQVKEQSRQLLENYRALSPKLELEYVDPAKEPTRTKLAGIRKQGTLVLQAGPRESKIEDVSEEKITSELIKLQKEKSPTFCAITGHGEKSFTANNEEGYELVAQGLKKQVYDVKEINLAVDGKIPTECDAIAIVGPTKSFLEPELKLVREYLDNGGRALFALDINIKGGEYAPELIGLLKAWSIVPAKAMVVDQASRVFGVDSSLAPLVTYAKDQPITRDFGATCFFPFARPFEIADNAPNGIMPKWLAKTTIKSFGVTDLKQITSGEVTFNEGKDLMGPLTVALAVDGKQKDSKATRNTRIVAFGTSYFAANAFAGMGGNLDFFLNSASWLLEDESLISVRAKEADVGKIELSEKTGRWIQLITIIVLPLLIAAGGFSFWIARRRM